ncbi:MAG TPA: amidase [Acidobacteriota bacterium]|jgi:amidase|nr:amidase [Acidobacteriota bacterium]HRV07118.1 amidase [Acidobacteriota bacterium]
MHHESSLSEKLSRRRFLQSTTVAAAAGLGGSSACRSGDREEKPGKSGWNDFELLETTIADLQRSMEAGERTAEEIVGLYLNRIEAMDRRGPRLQTVIELNPDAIVAARRCDEERRAGKARGPLHGIPVLVKDNLETGDSTATSAGSLALAMWRPSRDAAVAARLREAGAVILGKANLSEWANFRSERSSSGWSARGGQCRNPYVLDRNPCGSSSGSAAAVSANFCPGALGTETNGSIVCPSNACGVVGVKPTLGLVSRRGIIPIAHSQDTAGPITRTVADAALLLSVLAGSDPADPATAEADRRRETYPSFLRPDALRGTRIGVVRSYFGFHEAVDAVMESAVQALRDAGAEIVDPLELPHRREMNAASFEVLLYEFKFDLNRYLSTIDPAIGISSLEDLIRFNEEHEAEEMKYFGQEIFLAAQEKGPLTDEGYRQALETAKRLAGPEGIDRLMDGHGLDALIAPSGGPAWKTDLINGDHFLGGSSSPAAIAGYPNVTVPAGYVHGLPVGLSFFGRAWSETKLLAFAYAFERTTQARRPPEFVFSVEDVPELAGNRVALETT